jgi:phage gpG-like protein
MAQAVKVFIDRRFESKTGPRGYRWSRRKDRLPHPLMDKTGKLRAGWQKARVTYTATGFSISNRVPYAAVHQTGRSVPSEMDARQVFPTDGNTPKILQKEFEVIVRKHQKRIMKT